MRYGLSEDSISKICGVFELFPQVERVILYGSRAKGDFKPSSDVDLTLEGKDLTMTVLNKLNWQLDDLMLPYTMDLSILSHIRQSDLLDHIKRVGLTFYEKKK